MYGGFAWGEAPAAQALSIENTLGKDGLHVMMTHEVFNFHAGGTGMASIKRLRIYGSGHEKISK